MNSVTGQGEEEH